MAASKSFTVYYFEIPGYKLVNNWTPEIADECYQILDREKRQRFFDDHYKQWYEATGTVSKAYGPSLSYFNYAPIPATLLSVHQAELGHTSRGVHTTYYNGNSITILS